MGLDTLAMRGPDTPPTAEDLAAFDAAGVRLCECDGESTFRGKVHWEAVYEATGQVLPPEGRWAPAAIVRRMADRLEVADAFEVAERTNAPVAEVERDLRELARFFRVCAERDLGLLGG